MHIFRRPYDYAIHRRHPIWTVLTAEQYNLAFIRFDGVEIENAATITSCFLKVTAYGSATNNSQLTLAFVAADDPAAPTNEGELQALALTNNKIHWSPGTWVSGTTYTSPELKTSLQDVVNRGGWATGNALILVIKDAGSTSSRSFSSYDYDSASQKAALYVW